MLRDIAKNAIAQVAKQVPNREDITELALVALFAGGHILLTCQTGMGKTRWIRAISQALGLGHGRARFWDNMFLEDVFGTYGWNEETSKCDIWLPGAMYNQIVQVDNICVAHPCLHDNLMNAMDTGCINIARESLPMPTPFFLIATAKEPEGDPAKSTPLSDAIKDRFMMQLPLSYPGVAAEKLALQTLNSQESAVSQLPQLPVCNTEAIIQAKKEVQAVAVDDETLNYLISIVETTRRINAVNTGASPRAGAALMQGAKAYAAIKGRDKVVQDDVRHLVKPILSHRLKLSHKAIQDGMTPKHILESIAL